MNTYRSAGEVVTLTAPSGGVTKDQPVQIGQIVVIPTSTVAEGSEFEGMVRGVFSGLPKVGSQAWTEGVAIYLEVSTTPDKLTTHAGDNKWVGYALEAVGSGSGETTSGKIFFDGALTQANEAT